MTRRLGVIFALVIIVIVLVVGGLVMVKRSPSPTPQAETIATQASTQPSPASTKGTIQGLLTSRTEEKCQISYPDGQGSGIVFISRPNFRGDFTVNNTQTHMIYDGSYSYMWSDGTTTGTKFKIDPTKIATASAQTQGSANLSKEVDLKCTTGGVDSSKFVVPADIKFTDMTALLNKVPGPSGTTIPKVDKSVCDQAPTPEAKDACLKALGV